MEKDKQLSDLEAAAIALVKKEKAAWEDAVAFVTRKVAFNMRNLIEVCRKNYWGVFDKPTDPVTGKDKVWIPLTQFLVESVVKSIDLDTKDINMRSRNGKFPGLTSLVRNIVKNFLDELPKHGQHLKFGEILDDAERRLAIDGTMVWKTVEVKSKNGKSKTIKVYTPDLVNCYIDPTAESIQTAYRFTERSLMTPDEFLGMKGWMNTKDLTGGLLNRTDDRTTSNQGTGNYRDVYELWGKIPKYLMTNKESDKDLEVEGHVIVSGLEIGTPAVHLIEENKSGIRPYEEAWYIRVPGRWYGMGVCEKVMWLQVWLNTIVNIRINRASVSQLGIWKIRRGSGITPQMIGRLAANGAILVNSLDDIEQLTMNEASEASYKDEENIVNWGQRVTSAFEVITGETLPSSTTATVGAIQNNNAQSTFGQIKEGVGMFLERWVERHVMPVAAKNIKMGDVVRMGGEFEEIRQMDEQRVNRQLADQIDMANQTQQFLDPMQVEMERQRGLEQLTLSGPDRFATVENEIKWEDFMPEVYITNEDIDKGVLVQNLMTALKLAPEYRDVVLQQVFDLMGLDANLLRKQQMSGMAPQPGGRMTENDTQDPIQAITSANTFQNAA